MKSILTSIAFIIIAFSVTAQPPGPILDCGPSPWDGVGVNPPQAAHAFMCHTHSAPLGKYIYWDPFNHNSTATQMGIPPEDMAEWNWDNIYGMKGRYGINFPSYLGAGDTLSAQVFETKLNMTTADDADFQTFTDPVFDFYGGNYKFNILYVQAGTILRIHPGAHVEVHSKLVVDYAAVIEVMEGATLLLKSSRDNMAITNVKGAIEGELQKEIYFDLSDNWQAVNDVPAFDTELRFVFNPGMYNVDLHQVALDIQDAATIQLSNGVAEPSVQIGYWGRRTSDFITESLYDFAAVHTYEDINSSFQLNADSNLFVGEAALNADGFTVSNIPGQEFNLRTNSSAGHFYNWNEGVSIIPIYPPTNNMSNTDSELIEYWQNNDDFIEFADETININSNISDYAKTPISLNRTFTVSLMNVNSALTDFEIVVSGKFDSDKFIPVKNQSIDAAFDNIVLPYPGLTATYIGYADNFPEISSFFESTAIVDPPLQLLYGVDLYSRTSGDDYSNYRGIDFSGLSMVNNKTGNYLNTYQTLFQLFGAGPDAQLALFDIAPLISRQDERRFAIDSETNMMFEETSGNAFPIPVSNLLIWDDTAPEYPGIEVTDFYNIEDMKIFYAVGDTIRPDEMLAYNYNNPCDPTELEGQFFPNFAVLKEYDADWYNKGGFSNNGSGNPADTVYATETNNPVYRKTEQVYINNKPYLGSFKDVRVPVGQGNVQDELYDWTIEELNDMNEFTLLRLAGVTAASDTLTLAIVPMATDVSYSSTEIDLFESSVAVNPIMYLWSPDDSHVMSRRWGSYGRGINDFNDSLKLVIDFNALDYVTAGSATFTKLFIDAPVRQVGACGLSGDNLVVVDPITETNLYTWASDFEYEIDMNSTYNIPNPSGPSGDYGDGALIDLYFTDTQSDLNGDGCYTVADLIIFLGEFGANNVAETGDFYAVASDLNCDGSVTTSDLLIFLGTFGTCQEDQQVTVDESPIVLEKRIELYTYGWNNDHVTYDIVDDYPDFSQSQRDWFSLWPHPHRISVVDDLGITIAQEFDWSTARENGGQGNYSIKLPANRPTSAQLDTTSAKYSADLPQTDPSYRIYIEWLDGFSGFPGLPDGLHWHLCLGCKEDPNAVFPTSPTFIAN